jgi:hypothetical protein
MTHHIDINGVQAIEVGPVIPDLLSAHRNKRYIRRIVVRTEFGETTINLHASSAAQLDLPDSASPAPPPGRTGKSSSPVPRHGR